jgi:class 3 adenylate cyclase
MQIEEFFNQRNVVDLSFFNFRNAITAAYFANKELEILTVNDNFKSFFPVLGNVSNAYFPDVLEQLNVPGVQIDQFVTGLQDDGRVLIPEIHVKINGDTKVFSLLSTYTKDESFSYLNGVQGQFVDRTAEWELRQERESLLDQKLRDQQIIEEKSKQLENLATRLAKYLSPQIYETIFSSESEVKQSQSRKNLTVFFSDIERFTDISDVLEPEKLAFLINSYLSEMATIAIDCGGTIDKFIGDAVLVFFGDPDSAGEAEDALRCADMALKMRDKVQELQSYWRQNGISNEVRVRMGITTGYCTVGNFGSDKRMDYTVLGSPVNLAARLQTSAPANEILISESTHNLVNEHMLTEYFEQMTPKGFSRPLDTYKLLGFNDDSGEIVKPFYHVGEHIEVNLLGGANIRAAIEELKRIQEHFEQELSAPK